MQIWLSIFLGIGLAASSGFRVFVPLFALSCAAHLGLLSLHDDWQWVAAVPALVILGVASIVESISYLVPYVDHVLDSIALPLAGIAGTLVMASTLTDLSPAMTWTLAIIAGGGTAATIRSSAAAARIGVTAITGGVANPIISVAETSTAIGLSVLSLLSPVLAIVAFGVVITILIWGSARVRHLLRQSK